MAEQSGFFDAHIVDGQYDRVYLAASFAKYFASFVGNGVFGGKSSELIVRQKETANMSVSILPGQAWINGYWYENGDELSLSIDTADGVLNRIDSIVVRWSYADRAIRIAVKKGTPATQLNAVAPAVQRDNDFYELKLADIFIAAGTTKITQANIIDQRLNSDVCGFVVGLIKQFDTKDFGAQLNSYISGFKAGCDVWFSQFKTESKESVDEFIAELEELANDNDLVALNDKVTNILTRVISCETGVRDVAHGGTGQLQFTKNAVLVGNGVNKIEEVAPAKGAFYNDSDLNKPLFGTLPLACGGTGAATLKEARKNLGISSESFDAVLQVGSFDDSKVRIFNYPSVTATTVIELVPSSSITLEQFDALQAAKIIGIGQGAGAFIIKCLGDVPTIDIPVVFIVRGDM